ncbi:hypothetical protein K456DRAFT_1365937 [Colletotrichum gloeosporioides 23]|nr:hypothetical protein K456DRAFT_1365937 [Colletotrichum gloeosporioides 23]
MQPDEHDETLNFRRPREEGNRNTRRKWETPEPPTPYDSAPCLFSWPMFALILGNRLSRCGKRLTTTHGRGYPHRALLVHSVRDDPTPARLQHPIHTTTAPHARPSCRPAVARHEPRAWMPSRPHMTQSQPPDAPRRRVHPAPNVEPTGYHTWTKAAPVGSGPNPASATAEQTSGPPTSGLSWSR